MFANVAGGTETAADAPLVALPELDAPDALVDPAVPLAAVETTWNGAENRWGLEKSFWFEKKPSTH